MIPIEGGFRVAETETHHIDVLVMMFSWRIAETPKACPQTIDRHWCYAGRTQADLLRAVVAAVAWAESDDREPVGWNKNGVTGEWRDPVVVTEGEAQ